MMIVPRFWAECRLPYRGGRRRITVRRFGWSDASEADAQAVADRRAADALARILGGADLHRREPKLPYDGADGVPIREEIVVRHGDTVITRNAYGACCLNTPDVLFADIDFARWPSWRFTLAVIVVLVCATLAAGAFVGSGRLAGVLAVLAVLSGSSLASGLHRGLRLLRGSDETVARRRIAEFAARHPDWNFRIYRTPAGLRALATHGRFVPDAPDVAACFEALDADPVYARMCRRQHCFRARVSPKPWRIGMTGRQRPRPGSWPVAPERLPERQAWIAEYEAAAAGFAACVFVGSVGSGVVDPAVREVVALHDALCRSDTALPIA